MNKCRCESFRRVGGFRDFPDFDEFKRKVLESKQFSPVNVAARYSQVGGLEETWFECEKCNSVWRLVEPDPPFKGIWSKT